jgi:hypothetical protein
MNDSGELPVAGGCQRFKAAILGDVKSCLQGLIFGRSDIKAFGEDQRYLYAVKIQKSLRPASVEVAVCDRL